MKSIGTSLISLKNFIDNVKLIAGTRYSITHNSYDINNKKICSYSYINKHYKLTWNDILTKTGLNINRVLSFPIQQGRKKCDKRYYIVECLSCSDIFNSIDPKYNRICNKCKTTINFDSEDL